MAWDQATDASPARSATKAPTRPSRMIRRYQKAMGRWQTPMRTRPSPTKIPPSVAPNTPRILPSESSRKKVARRSGGNTAWIANPARIKGINRPWNTSFSMLKVWTTSSRPLNWSRTKRNFVVWKGPMEVVDAELPLPWVARPKPRMIMAIMATFVVASLGSDSQPSNLNRASGEVTPTCSISAARSAPATPTIRSSQVPSRRWRGALAMVRPPSQRPKPPRTNISHSPFQFGRAMPPSSRELRRVAAWGPLASVTCIQPRTAFQPAMAATIAPARTVRAAAAFLADVREAAGSGKLPAMVLFLPSTLATVMQHGGTVTTRASGR